MAKQTIIWDFDGTLADSFAFVSDFIARSGGRTGLTLVQRQQQLGGMSMRGMAKKLHIPKWRQLWLFLYGRHLMTRQLDEIKLFDGVKPVIQELHRQGHVMLALSSNSKKNIRLFLEHNDLAEYFTDMQGNASFFGKAHAMRNMLRRNSLMPENCVCVGDEAGDIQAARKVGAPAVAVAWGYNSEKRLMAEQPLAIAHKPADLLKVLREP